MPRNPYYSGPLANRVSQAYGPSYSAGDVIAPALTDAVAGKGGILSRLFGPDPNDPDAAQAAYYRAKAAEVQSAIDDARDKTRRRQEGETAAANFVATADDLTIGGPRAMLGGYSLEGAGVDEQSSSRLLPNILRAYAHNAAQSGDKDGLERLSPILRAYVTATGDPNAIITMNSGMGFDADYVKGPNGVEAATGAQQQAQIEDAAAQAMRLEQLESADRRYGVDRDYQASVYNTNVDAGTARRGQDVTASTTRRGQNLDYQSQAAGRVVDAFNSAYTANFNTRAPKVETTTVREPGKPPKTRTTATNVPPRAGARPAHTAPAAGAPPAGQRVKGKTYSTPRGPMTWTGTGWVPAAGT